MALRRVHEYLVDDTTKKARISGVFPIRRYVNKDHGPVNFQQGKFYDDGGNELAREDIPPYILEDVAKHPVVVSAERQMIVLRRCPLCRDAGQDVTIPSNEFEAHLLAHARGQVEAPTPEKEDA